MPFRITAHSGKFDGFPTGCCVEASLSGMAMVCSDVLEMNAHYRGGIDICIVEPDPAVCAARVARLRGDPEELAQLGRNGQAITTRLFTADQQLGKRHALLEQLC